MHSRDMSDAELMGMMTTYYIPDLCRELRSYGFASGSP